MKVGEKNKNFGEYANQVGHHHLTYLYGVDLIYASLQDSHTKHQLAVDMFFVLRYHMSNWCPLALYMMTAFAEIERL